MSKIAAIDAAIRLQLAEDGKSIGYSDPLTGGEGYTGATDVEEFLLGIAKRLRLDTPPLRFPWMELDAATIIISKLHVVHAKIAERTAVEKSDD
ncbi:hypothetical protein [Rhizobium sp. PL01]|uniref:hypothetical protein n=1 Tax=Rhizobium sp. PL01 TaxID=3085631 RepID=UPI002980F1E8|nr:hypothetical protein [Rhizobium sp. PL01]MDW5314523.1 hypothetical protein [Rhizobium sp. PL01]